jgi:Ca-activated chloride channel family protein
MVMSMIPEWIALAVALLALGGEWMHARRCRRVARLAFGPMARARIWTRVAPLTRVMALTLLAWGMVQLYFLTPRVVRPSLAPEGGYRHLVITLDVSPSMTLKDAGPLHQQTRASRASEVVLSVLQRVALDQLRVSVVAFYTSGKPVVVDTFDLAVVKNILNDLPLAMAFDTGKTSLIAGIRASAEVAKTWVPDSTTLLVVSDGDTVPDTGMPELPRSINNVVVLGVGKAQGGANIDGHLSRQDASTLRQLATRVRGAYHDVNDKHLPSAQLAALAKVLPMKDQTANGRREWALAAVLTGASLLASLSVLLALAGSPWRPGVREPRETALGKPRPRNAIELATVPNS